MPVATGLHSFPNLLSNSNLVGLDDCVSNAGPCALPLCHQRPGREGENLVHLDRSVGSGSYVCYFCSRSVLLSSPATACSLPMGWDISIDQRNKSGLCKIFSVLHTSVLLGTHSPSPPTLEYRSPSKIVSVKVVVSLPDPSLFSHSVYLTLCNPTDCSTPGFPVLHQLLELAQTHVLWVGDAIQLSHPLSPTSPPALNLFQHQGLFQWVGSSRKVAKVVKFQLPYTNIFYTHTHTYNYY